MEIIINQKTYKSKRITGRIYDRYMEMSESIEKRQAEEKNGFTKTDLALIRDFLVEFFDNQFTADILYDEVEVSSLIVYYLSIIKEVETQMQSKMEKLAKN